jgi:hypothetical protein
MESTIKLFITVLCADGEVKVPNDIRERWSVFDDRFDGQDNVSDEEKYTLSVPYCKEEVENWCEIDRMCQLITARTQHCKVQFPISNYEPICRFMNHVSDDFWIYLLMDEKYPECAKLSAYRAISNANDRAFKTGCMITDTVIYFVNTVNRAAIYGKIQSLCFYGRHRREELMNYDEGIILAGGPVCDRYLYGNAHALLNVHYRYSPFLSTLSEHILYILPLSVDINCRRKRLELFEFLQTKNGRQKGYDGAIKALNELVDIPLGKSKKSLLLEQDDTMIDRYLTSYNSEHLLGIAGIGLILGPGYNDDEATYFPEHRKFFRDTKFTTELINPPELYSFVLRTEAFRVLVNDIITTFGLSTLVFMCKICVLYKSLGPCNNRVNKFLQIAKNACSVDKQRN